MRGPPSASGSRIRSLQFSGEFISPSQFREPDPFDHASPFWEGSASPLPWRNPGSFSLLLSFRQNTKAFRRRNLRGEFVGASIPVPIGSPGPSVQIPVKGGPQSDSRGRGGVQMKITAAGVDERISRSDLLVGLSGMHDGGSVIVEIRVVDIHMIRGLTVSARPAVPQIVFHFIPRSRDLEEDPGG